VLSLLIQSPSGSAFFCLEPFPEVLSLIRTLPEVLTFVTEPYRDCSLVLQSPTGSALFCYRDLPEGHSFVTGP
jgi:hypothetical protein